MKCHLCKTRGCSSGEPCSEGRVLGHNPVSVLYSQYLRKNLKYSPEERKV